MKKSSEILTILLSLLFSYLFLVEWIPQKVGEHIAVVSPKKEQQETQLAKQQKEKSSLPESLKEYLREQRQTANSESDSLNYEDLVVKNEELVASENSPTNELLEKKFAPFLSRNEEMLQETFEVPEGLKDRVRFWIHFFGVYDKNNVIFYNSEDVSVVYSVLDFSDLSSVSAGVSGGLKNRMIRQERARVLKLVSKLSQWIGKDPQHLTHLNDEEKRLLTLLNAHRDHIGTSSKDLKASLSYRNGFAHRMRKAIATSGHYMAEMQRVFRERGLPTELTVLPFIESAFHLEAYSSAAAAGIWQFIEATGRNYLKIDEYVDERYDPILATYAAASHLAKEYKLLKSWPLTINAYNTGPGRMLQAVRQLKTTNIEKIIKHFKGRGYGFDSSNYYPEFLAALEVYRNRHLYFGDVLEHPEKDYEYIELTQEINVLDLIDATGIQEDQFRRLNLALKPSVLNGTKKLPKGYLLKVPPKQKQNVLLALQELKQQRQYAAYHVVEKNEGVKDIAKIYGVAPREIEMMNNLLPGETLRAGEILKLPFNDQDADLGYTLIRDGEKDQKDFRDFEKDL